MLGSYELRVLRASADGVEPALLLAAPGKKAEYLFNVPDGFSRLALEHKRTPTARLSCILLTSLLPPSTGGLGGLILKLRQDGHGQVQLIGPRGSSKIVHSLRHICKWTHPKVFVNECMDSGPVPVFEDAHVVIVPLVAGDQTTGCPWCIYQTPKSEPRISHSPGEDTSSSSDNSGSSSSSEKHSTSIAECDDGDSLKKRSDISNDSLNKTQDMKNLKIEADSLLGNGVNKAGFQTQEAASNGKSSWTTLPQRRKREEAAGNSLHLDVDNSLFEKIKDQLKKARATRPGSGSSYLGSSAFSNKQTKLNAELCCNDMIRVPSEEGGDCCSLGFSLKHSTESNALKEGIAGGNQQSHICKTATDCKDFQVSPQLEHTQFSTVDSDRTPEFPSRRCDGASDLRKQAEGLKNMSMKSVDDCICQMSLEEGSSESVPGHSIKRNPWCISNVQQNELPLRTPESNPLYARDLSGHCTVVAGVEGEKLSNPDRAERKLHEEAAARVLGYLCFLRSLNKAVLVVHCEAIDSVSSLREHQVLSCLSDQSQKIVETHAIASVVHLTPHSVLHSGEYQQWMQSFRCACHVVMKEDILEFGFRSSLATLRKLNNIHEDIFPRPPNMNSWSESRPSSLKELAETSSTVVNGGLWMGLNFSENTTTLIYEKNYLSAWPVRPKVVTPQSTSQLPAEVHVFTAGDQKSEASSYIQLSANELAAVAIKKRLLEQKVVKLYPCSTAPKLKSIKPDHARTEVDSTFQSGGQQSAPPATSIDDQGTLSHGVDLALDFDSSVPLAAVGNGDEQDSPMLTVQEVRLCQPDSDFELLFLGTGSAEPSKKRGSSGILFQVKGAQGAMLLDAGEGSAGQLIRRFGDAGARAVISSLQCLWLSHKHGDHVLGVLSILKMRSTQVAPLIVIGPHVIHRWLSEVSDTLASSGFPVPRFNFIHCEDLSDSLRFMKNPEHAKQISTLLHAMQLRSMIPVRVFHCYDAFGIVLNGRAGWRVVYSGDTRPSKQLADAGQGCTLLIHEATFEDSLQFHANQKRHSTVSEAVGMGLYMRAQHTILTHFSQRYPELVDIEGNEKENVSLAFDGMVVPSHLLSSLGKLQPQIRKAFQKADISAQMTDMGPSMPIIEDGSTHLTNEEPYRDFNSSDITQSPAAKHTRWSSPSDDDDHKCAHQSLRWTSDSDEEGQFGKKAEHVKLKSSFAKQSPVTKQSSMAMQSPIAKHTRWLSDDDEEEEAAQSLNGQQPVIRWSSDSE